MPSVKEVLGSDDLPSAEALQTLEWRDTISPGVYGQIIITEVPGYHSHLYVGSATANHGRAGAPQRRP